MHPTRCFEAAGGGGGYILISSDHFFEADLNLLDALPMKPEGAFTNDRHLPSPCEYETYTLLSSGSPCLAALISRSAAARLGGVWRRTHD
jgi:hypothetical protein